MSIDFIAVANSIAKTAKKAGAPLSEDQRLVLVGALAVWLDKAYAQGYKAGAAGE